VQHLSLVMHSYHDSSSRFKQSYFGLKTIFLLEIFLVFAFRSKCGFKKHKEDDH